MIFMTQYDPDATDTAPVGRSQYVSKKDIRIVAVALIVAAIAAVPLYRKYRDQAYARTCFANMRAVHQAVTGYMSQNDDHLPPVYYPDAEGNPVLVDGVPVTWVTLVQPDMSKRLSFTCPSATEDEVSKSLGSTETGPLPSTYGMLTPLGLKGRIDFETPGETVLVAETSNHGSQTSYNPLTFKDQVNDGFAIGYEKAQDFPDVDTQKSNFVTRLAFRGTAKGTFDANAEPRHSAGINYVTFDGQASRMPVKGAFLTRHGNQVVGTWNPATRR